MKRRLRLLLATFYFANTPPDNPGPPSAQSIQLEWIDIFLLLLLP